MINEIELMEYIQKLKINNLMIYISEPFNTSSFILLIIIINYYKILNYNNIKKILLGSLIGLVLKLFFKRTRPYQSSTRIRNYSNKVHNTIFNKYSFPSGHVFISTLLTLILLKKYPKHNILKIIPFLVSLSRVFLGVHYPSDIIGGMILAYLFFNIVPNKI